MAERTYIVVFKNDVSDPGKAAAEQARANGAEIRYVYRHAIKGYAARMSDVAAARIANSPRVAFVEADGQVASSVTQTSAPWGLDRIDQVDLPLSTTYFYDATGAGVTAYIIDTGIRVTHAQFGGRATSGWDFIGGDSNADDCNGHGTHVAGTVGGSTYGVAKSVSLVALRVLNCQGTGADSGVIAAVDWVTADHNAGESAVANMSLGGGTSDALDTAVANSIADGVTYAAAAGNGDKFGNPLNACNESPARVAQALTVSATSNTDAKASWANFGTCVDLFAPGVNITSAWKGSNTDTRTISGTSMATPHVAGVAALYLQANPSASPSTVHGAIVSGASVNKVSSPGSGSPNRLLYSLILGDWQPPVTTTTTTTTTTSTTTTTTSTTTTLPVTTTTKATTTTGSTTPTTTGSTTPTTTTVPVSTTTTLPITPTSTTVPTGTTTPTTTTMPIPTATPTTTRITELGFGELRLKVRGGMTPFAQGLALDVDLLRKRSWGWVRLARKTKTLDEAGNFFARLPRPTKDGTYKVRARFNGDEEFAGSMVKKVFVLS